MKKINNRKNKLIQMKPVKYFSKENFKLSQKIGRRADSKFDRRRDEIIMECRINKNMQNC